MKFDKLLKIIALALLVLVASNLINQAVPHRIPGYWGIDEIKDEIVEISIKYYGEDDEADKTVTLTNREEINQFYQVLEETKLKRLWKGSEQQLPSTCQIRIFTEDGEDDEFWMELVDEKVYFINMRTYEWYIEDDSPLMEYIEENK